jgi:hypothetical protein
MAISQAGDWTAAFIEDPPAHVWLRGVPTMELANVRRLFPEGRLREDGQQLGRPWGTSSTARLHRASPR